MDDTADAMEYQRELNDVLSGQFSATDDTELEAELAAMEAEEAALQALVSPARPRDMRSAAARCARPAATAIRAGRELASRPLTAGGAGVVGTQELPDAPTTVPKGIPSGRVSEPLPAAAREPAAPAPRAAAPPAPRMLAS
jgi:hypothetical protein